ncbi:hypothetical protein BAUCODRAFT_20776 [Baudoinia panamericana UAMH 10762]|uniref:Uncharacterized protein n=1 Tax=Baudoinia panamericana (strain UAMH 10762) TaxID=717646 RepID=M2NMH9_BAUPA|nr:uncharacterized protein BAUCODRAFT_20776 [Baudoinia panamericana UAMH 10762]EMD00730.1 hypothetical protein BAUCODRAFT_20776 [Baudoinia panamericana UAMH 10762]
MPSRSLRPLLPRHSLRNILAAIKPSSSKQVEAASSPSTSPLSASRSVCSSASSFGFSGFNLDRVSSRATDERLSSTQRAIRRKKSVAEMEQEEERLFCSDALLRLVEPRPYAGPTLGGIEEVLDGSI